MATVDFNLVYTILPQLVSAMTDANGQRTGDIVIVNSPNLAQDRCPESTYYVEQFNDHLAFDAAVFGIPVADAYAAFYSNSSPNEKLCSYTWVCALNDIHETGGQPGEPGNGYGVIAGYWSRLSVTD